MEDAALALEALAGYDSRDPFSLDSDERFTPAVRRPISGWRIAYSPDFDVFPVDKRVAEVVGGAVQAFEQAGAQVEEVRLGIERDQRELSDLWCRLIMPINVETFENFKRNGVDLLDDHREDFPPEYLRWVEEGYRLSALDLSRDQQTRAEIYDAIQRVLDDHHLLVTLVGGGFGVVGADPIRIGMCWWNQGLWLPNVGGSTRRFADLMCRRSAAAAFA